MNRRQFEAMYAYNSGLTVKQLHGWGRRGARCDCGDEICDGWQMLHDAHGPAWWRWLKAHMFKTDFEDVFGDEGSANW